MLDYQRVPRVLHALMLALLLAICLTGTALAEDDDVPAYQVYDSLLDASSSVEEFNCRIINDLAGRWFYADSAKQAKVPVVQSAYLGVSDASLPSLLEDLGSPPAAYTYFTALNAFATVMDPFPLIDQVYNLVTLDGGVVWDTSSAGARDEYRAWYEYFQGTSSGGSGGSGGVTEQGEYVYIPVSEYAPLPQVYQGVDNVRVKKSQYQVMQDYVSANGGSIFVCVYGAWCVVEWHPSNVDIFAIELNPAYHSIYEMTYASNDIGSYSAPVISSRSNNIQGDTLIDDSDVTYGSVTMRQQSEQGYSYWMAASTVGPVYLRNVDVGGDGTGGGPSEPVYPTPPAEQLPTLPPDGSAPTVNVPLTTQPTYEGNGTGTTTADLAPILEVLRSINTNLVTGFEHFEGVLNDQMAALQDYLQTWNEWWKSFFTGWRDTWQEWERDFMRECNRANSWLERIYYKTGSGKSSRPDPSIKPTETVNWWDALAQKFMSMLPAAVQDIVSQLSRLNSVFPFSIPWDVGAILGLFSQPAATPVFDLTIPNVDGSTWTARINLSQWNGVALVIRRCELFVFAIQLMMWTPDVIKQLEVS